MNSQQHAHTLQFRAYRRGGPTYNNVESFKRYNDDDKIRGITYGDQQMAWPSRIPFRLEQRRARKIKAIIARHNRESVKAGKKKEKEEKGMPDYASLVNKYSKMGWKDAATASR